MVEKSYQKLNDDSYKVKKIYCITTGGTIEKTYDKRDGSLANRDSILEKLILKRLKTPHTDIEVVPIMNKDSLDMANEDRLLILNTVRELSEKKAPIVVVHGTDTMTKSAEFCAQNLKNLKVPVIFTGAMIPLGFVETDAFQNISEAFLAAKILSAGIYLVFHNQVFLAGHVVKNHEKVTFDFT